MAECKECGKKFGFLEQSVGGLCSQCNYLSTISPDEAEQLDQVKQDWENTQVQLSIDQAEIDSITITTEAVPSLKIVKRIDVISAQAAFEINNFKDMFVGFMNPVKGRSNELEKQLDELKVKSTQKLKTKAHEVGANAVVAVDLDLSTVTIGSISMMVMMASGTAVVIEE